MQAKILISSTTNVAVDRILLGLLELGFSEFVRVGSARKIAKRILPFSTCGGNSEKQVFVLAEPSRLTIARNSKTFGRCSNLT